MTLWAAGWTGLYVISKVAYALDGRLGVTGGPEVPPDRYANDGPGEVAAAQWANAAVGALGVLLLLFALTPLAARLNRWLLSVPLLLIWLMAVAGAVGMLGRALLTDAGGALFGGYCVVWSVFVGAAVLACHRRPVRISAGAAAGGEVANGAALGVSNGHQWPAGDTSLPEQGSVI